MGGQLNGLEQFELQILSLTNNNTCGTLPTTRCRRDVEWAAMAYLRTKCGLGTYHQVASTRRLGSMVIEKCVLHFKRRSARWRRRPLVRVDGP